MRGFIDVGSRGLSAIILALVMLLHGGAARALGARAEEIFSGYGPAVIQVRVVDRASGDKSSLGSGFQIDADGLLATNFHVIAEFAHKPERFRIEYFDAAGKPVPLELVDVDVIHDLALLRTAAPLPQTLAVDAGELVQGERLYSMGNPLDLAMTIIEGTYNGFVSGARYRKILFSGSLNPGMSGGPAFNDRGSVVGVNVAHGGEQISFLVPSHFLAALVARQQDAGWRKLAIRERIAQALGADEAQFYAGVLGSDWERQRFGEFSIPGKLSPTMKCWGGSTDDKENHFDHAFQECASEDSIFLDEGFETGGFKYAFHSFSSDRLNSLQFYSMLGSWFRHAGYYNANDKEQVSNYRCREDFVAGVALGWRLNFCARRYREYAGLFDVSAVLASTSLHDRGLVVRIAVNGISEDAAIALVRRFVERIEWKP